MTDSAHELNSGGISYTNPPFVQAIFYNNPDTYPPIVNSIRLLADAGIQTELFCREDGARWGVIYPEGTRILRFDTKGNGSWQEYIGFLKRVLKAGKRKSSAFIGHNMHGLLPARMLASWYRRPLLYHCHDFAERHSRINWGSRLVRSFEQVFARTSDVVIVPDADRAEVIKEKLFLKPEPMIVANAPIKRSLTPNNQLQKALASRGLSFDRIIFRQGRIGVGHVIEATLHSIQYWKSRRWGFVVMGPGDGSYIENLVLKSQELGVEEQFVVLPAVGYDTVESFTVGADVGHALYEPIHVNNVYITTASNKIMEYMQAGLPLLVSDSESLRALVNRTKCGIAVNEGSPEKIAEGVNTLLGNPELSRRMGIAARQAFENEFCFQKQFSPVVEVIRQFGSLAQENRLAI